MWHTLLNEGEKVARCTVERLMKDLDIKGAVRGKIKRTTIAVKAGVNAEDLVRRNFSSTAPNKLWVADFTYISTWEGWCYTAFVVDVFARRIIGHSVSTQMSKEMVASAFRMALYARAQEGNDGFDELIHHNDKGSQYTADDFSELLSAHGVRLSIGSVGDSYDNALAETINGAYKTELTKRFGPWECFEELKLETARWVHWFNTERISEYNNYKSPQTVEEVWYSDGIDLRKGSRSKV